MSLTPDDDFAAAEFALGTLSPSERAALAARRLREPALDAAIRNWEARLAPLAEAAPPVAPPGDYLAAIEARIAAASAAQATAAPEASLAALRTRLARWRALAIAASLAAVLLAVGFAVRETARVTTPREYVAILQKDAGSPAIEVTVDLDRRELRARRVAAEPPPGKAYELWIIDASLGAPRSLGLVGPAARGASLAAYDPAVVENATYAVTVEPPGGAPNGKPSGPPVFVGKLIPVEP